MRVVSLAKVAAEAEGLRLRSLVKRQARRAIWAAVAAVFALFLGVMVHLALFVFLVRPLGPRGAALIVLALDVIGVIVFGLLAARSTPGADEREAELISRQARLQLSDAFTTVGIMAPVARLTGASGFKATLMSLFVEQFLKGRRRR